VKSAGTDNAQEILRKAELALAGGNFVKANRISKDASGLLDKTQDLHRKFMKKMKRFIDKILDMEERGFDVAEAMEIMSRSKDKAIRADYNKAMRTMDLVNPALERATYLPFPLFNKTVDLITTVFYSGGRVSYTVRIENPTEEPLGEIIITPQFQEDEFHEVPEKPFGIIGGREYKEYTFYLTPKNKNKEWHLGIGAEILMEEGVTFRTKLSSRNGTAKYLVVVENNNDQMLRDIEVRPQTPGGLIPDPSHGVIDMIEPFSNGSVTFDLYPSVINPREARSPDEIVVVVTDEEPYEPPENNEFMIEEEEEVDDIIGFDEDEGELTFDVDEIDENDQDEGPKDFTPVMEEYDLIEMAPNKYPDDVEDALKKKSKKKRSKNK
jgi:hypothetical protein